MSGFVVKTEPASVLLCSGCLDHAPRPDPRLVDAMEGQYDGGPEAIEWFTRMEIVSSTCFGCGGSSEGQATGWRQFPLRAGHRVEAVPPKGRPQGGGSFPLLPACHRPLGSQHWEF
jgi:hypothetical protein